MKWDEIERELANQAKKESYSVDTEELWGNVSPHIPQEKKRDRFMLFWIFIGACAAGLIMSQGILSNKEDTMMISEIDSLQRLEILVDQYTDANDPTDLEIDDINTIHGDSPTVQLTSTSFSEPHESEISMNSSTYNEKPGYPIQLSHFKVKLEKKTITAYQENILKEVALAAPLSKPHTESITSGIQEPINSIYAKNNLHGESNLSQEPLSLLELLHIKELQNKLTLNESPLSASYEIVKLNKLTKLRLYVEAAGSLALGHGGLSLRSDDWAESYQHRSNAETTLPSYAGRLQIGLAFNDRWSIQAGLSFQQLYKRSISEINSAQDVTVDDAVIQQIIDTNGSRFITGSAVVQEITTSDASRISYIRTLDVPIDVIYTFRTQQIYWDISMGLSYSIAQSRSGFIHPSENIEYDTSTDEFNWYNAGHLWSTQVSAGLRIPLSQNIDLLTRSRYKYYLTDQTLPSYGIREDLSHWQFELGARYNF